MKNESIDNICVETSQPTRTGRGSFWQNLKNYLPPSSGQAGTLTWCSGRTRVRRRYCGFIGGAWLELWESTQSYFIAHNEIWRPVLLAGLCRRGGVMWLHVAPDIMGNMKTQLSPSLAGWPGLAWPRSWYKIIPETFINLPFKSSMDIFCQRIVWFCLQ